MATVALPASRGTTIILWILRVFAGVIFILAAMMKLSGQPMMVQEFDTVGLGQWLRYLTGLMELAGGIAVLIPAVSVFGAIILLAVDVGACIAQITVLHMDWIHTVVIGLILAAIIYLQRGRLGVR